MKTNITPDLVTALVAAQGNIKNPSLDSTNPHFRSKFASLGACVAAVKEPLLAEGLVVTQITGYKKHKSGGVSLEVDTWVLGHGGQLLLGTVPMPMPSKPQEVGSAVTYARRYGICSAFGIVGEEDDDGNAANASTPATTKKAAKKAAPGKPKAAAASAKTRRATASPTETRRNVEKVEPIDRTGSCPAHVSDLVRDGLLNAPDVDRYNAAHLHAKGEAEGQSWSEEQKVSYGMWAQSVATDKGYILAGPKGDKRFIQLGEGVASE
jgi:hypothetical protein